jgi:predicted DCC family thiol-disulfide oxidoreductase YuxK
MKIIFFDGHCGLCNGFVDFILKVDKQAVFHFSPLQGQYAQEHLTANDTADLKSIVLLMEGKTYRKADAVLRILTELPGAWKLSSILRALPFRFLNIGYDLIARNRYSLFGKSPTCRLPSAVEKTRFII